MSPAGLFLEFLRIVLTAHLTSRQGSAISQGQHPRLVRQISGSAGDTAEFFQE